MSERDHPKPVLGLLGAPGSGKSAVAAILSEHGAAVIDADAIAKAQLDQPEVIAAIRDRFGDGVIDDSGGDGGGRVDRAALGRVVFDDDEARHWLEAVIHPRVHAERRRLRERHFADAAVSVVVEDCPLLIESGLAADCDALVYVEASRAVREQRVARARGWTPEELDRRERSQASLDMKRSAADYVVVNEAGLDALTDGVLHVLASLHDTRNEQDRA